MLRMSKFDDLRRNAFIAYIAGGDPPLEATEQIILELDAW